MMFPISIWGTWNIVRGGEACSPLPVVMCLFPSMVAAMQAKSFVRLHNIIEVLQISFYSNIAFQQKSGFPHDLVSIYL